MEQAKCCQIGCDLPAEYEISIPHGRIEDITQACAHHIPDLLTDAPVHEVERLNARPG
jgi:hypothetical protein